MSQARDRSTIHRSGKTALPVKAWKAEYAKLTAERETLNRRHPERGSERSRANPKERLQCLAAETAGAAAPQGAGYRVVTDRAAGKATAVLPEAFI